MYKLTTDTTTVKLFDLSTKGTLIDIKNRHMARQLSPIINLHRLHQVCFLAVFRNCRQSCWHREPNFLLAVELYS